MGDNLLEISIGECWGSKGTDYTRYCCKVLVRSRSSVVWPVHMSSKRVSEGGVVLGLGGGTDNTRRRRSLCWSCTKYIQAGSRSKNLKCIPRKINVLRHFSIQTRVILPHVFYVPLRRPHPMFFFLLVPDFSSVEIFSGNVDHLGPIFFGKKKRKPPPGVRPRDGHVEHGRKVSGPLSKTARTFGLLCVQMSKIRYFLQMTWF